MINTKIIILFVFLMVQFNIGFNLLAFVNDLVHHSLEGLILVNEILFFLIVVYGFFLIIRFNDGFLQMIK